MSHEQLWGAIGAVFGSWMNARADHLSPSCTTSPRTGARPSTCRRWCSATGATTSATGVAFTRDPATGESSFYGEFLINAQGEDVVAGIRTPQTDHRSRARRQAAREALDGEAMPEAFAEFKTHRRSAREALPRHAGHRVHGRGRQALHAPDPQRQAHRRGGAEDRRRHGERGADRHARGRAARRSRGARPAAAPDASIPNAERQRDRARACRLARAPRPARSSSPPTRPRARKADGRDGDPGARRDQPGGHPRHACRATASSPRAAA